MFLKFQLLSIIASLFSTYLCATINDNRVSFKNVCVLGENESQFAFNITIVSSNKLTISENITFDRLTLLNDIPILYENAITDMDNLKELAIDSNNLHEIRPGAFKNLSKTIDIYITENELKEIKSGVFSNLPIRILDLSYNKIEKIDAGAFSNMIELREIDLKHNNLKKWHNDWFKNTPKLFWIFARFNQIEELPADAFEWLKDSIDVGIWLDNNKIKKIHKDTFKHLDATTIDLSENEIETLDVNWLDGNSVRSIDISKNKLTCLHGDLDKIFKAKTTNIDGNPWDCECLRNIKTYSDNHQQKMIVMTESVQSCKV